MAGDDKYKSYLISLGEIINVNNNHLASYGLLMGKPLIELDDSLYTTGAYGGYSITPGSYDEKSHDFKPNIVRLNQNFPSDLPSQYEVEPGDTYDSIALKLCGDMAFANAIANLNGNIKLTTGIQIRIPQFVPSHNSAQTSIPYRKFIQIMMSDMYPHLEAMPLKVKHHHTNFLHELIEALVAIVVALVVPELAPLILTQSTLGFALIMAAAGGLSNAAAQGVAVALGDQEKFKLSSTLQSALAAGITAGIVGKTSSSALKFSEEIRQIAKSMVADELAQLACGQKLKFNWQQLLVAIANQVAMTKLNESLDEQFGPTHLTRFAEGIINTTFTNITQAALTNHLDLATIAAQILGTTIGEAIVNTAESIYQQKQFTRAREETGLTIQGRKAEESQAKIKWIHQEESIDANKSSNSFAGFRSTPISGNKNEDALIGFRKAPESRARINKGDILSQLLNPDVVYEHYLRGDYEKYSSPKNVPNAQRKSQSLFQKVGLFAKGIYLEAHDEAQSLAQAAKSIWQDPKRNLLQPLENELKENLQTYAALGSSKEAARKIYEKDQTSLQATKNKFYHIFQELKSGNPTEIGRGLTELGIFALSNVGIGEKFLRVVETDEQIVTVSQGIKSGRQFRIELAGGPLRNLVGTQSKIKITHRGIDVLEKHISRFGLDAGNQYMVRRLRAIAGNEISVTQIDKNFYSHELREFVRYRRLGWETGLPTDINLQRSLWNNAHTATLEEYGLSSKLNELYTIEAIQVMESEEEILFNQYLKLEKI